MADQTLIDAEYRYFNNANQGLNPSAYGANTFTPTQVAVRVVKTNASLVSLIGLTILSVPTSVGATFVHITASDPS